MILKVSSSVCNPLITSTNFITGTGFMKCIPITLFGFLVKEAIFVIEMEDVLVAKIV